MVKKFEEKPGGPSVPIGSVEVRTFMHKPLCAKCKDKGVSRFLVQSESALAVTSLGDPAVTWWCDHCDHHISLPPGLFPMFEQQEIRLEPVRNPSNQGKH